MNHMEFAAMETKGLSDTSPWSRWFDKVEEALGHAIDGDQEVDGYSDDDAYDCFKLGYTVEQYVAHVDENKAALAAKAVTA